MQRRKIWAALQSGRGAPARRLLDNSGSEGAERARGLVTSPGGTSQHAGYDAHLNRTEFSDLVRAAPPEDAHAFAMLALRCLQCSSQLAYSARRPGAEGL